MPKMYPSAWDKNLAAKLKYLREKKGFSQEYVARRLGLTCQMYQRYENGEAMLRARTAAQVAYIYKINATWLLSNLAPPVDTEDES